MDRLDTYRAADRLCKTRLRKSPPVRLYRRLHIRKVEANVRREIVRDLLVKTKRALIFALVHFTILAVSFTVAFSWTMQRFDAGEPVPMMETMLDGIVSFLTAPLIWLSAIPASESLVTALQWPFIVLNSLAWGFAVEFTYSRFRRSAPHKQA